VRYTFRPLQELYWALLTGVGIVLFQALLTLEPEQVTDWQTWAVALGGALVRAVGGAGIDYLRRSMTNEPEPDPTPPAVDVVLVTALADELERRREERIQARLRAVEGAG
jgi:hypothetical protein